MIELLPFKPIHGMALMDDIAQEIPRRLLWVLGTEKWNEIAAPSEGRAWTGRDEGDIFCCGGVIPSWHGCCRAWAMVSKSATVMQMLWLHREARFFLDQLQDDPAYRRVETTALVNFKQANQWLGLLGFECEGTLQCYDADGHDHRMYARVACHSNQPRSPRSAPLPPRA